LQTQHLLARKYKGCCAEPLEFRAFQNGQFHRTLASCEYDIKFSAENFCWR